MDQTLLWVLVALAAVVVAGVTWFALHRQPREARQLPPSRLVGPKVIGTDDHARSVEASPVEPSRRPERPMIRTLGSDDALRFGASWRQLQAQFIDDPERAVTEADRLVGEVMNVRGYPVGDFEQRMADIAVDHPDVVMHYRAGREIAVMHARGETNTEDLRQAMVHYRALFRNLLETAKTGEREQRIARDTFAERER
jgi:hypothetical protein